MKATKNGDFVKAKNTIANIEVTKKLLKGMLKKSYRPITAAIMKRILVSLAENFI